MANDLPEDNTGEIPNVNKIPDELDIRKDSVRIADPTPVGPALAVDVTELLRRGFKSLTVDEQAVIIAGYLSTQKTQLSVYDTPDEVKEKMTKLEMEQTNNKTKNLLTVASFVAAVVGFFGLTGILIYTVAKQGVLSDSTVFQGMMTMVQEVFKVVFSGGKY